MNNHLIIQLFSVYTISLYSMESPILNSNNNFNPSQNLTMENGQIINFYQKAKALYENRATNGEYKEFVSELHQQNFTVQNLLISRLEYKREKACEAISNEFEILPIQLSFLTRFLKNRPIQKSKNINQYKMKFPNKLTDQIYDQSFKNLLRQYRQCTTLQNLTIKFGEKDECCISTIPSDTDLPFFENILQFSIKFFEYSLEEQEFTFAHEFTHAEQLHTVTEYILNQYCLLAKLIKNNNSEIKIPEFNTWLTEKSNQEIKNLLFRAEPYIQFFKNSVTNKPSFLKLSRANEYEADNFFSSNNIELAKKIRTFIFEKMIEEKSQLNNDEKKSTHPSWKKRFTWMDRSLKLLEAEQNLKNSN